MTYKFIVKTNHEASEIISDAMFELGAMGISITDPKDFDEIDKNGVVWDYIEEADKIGIVTIEGFVDTDSPEEYQMSLRKILKHINSFIPLPDYSFEVLFELVPEVDWRSEWKKYYKPIILDKISIFPSWIEPYGEKYVIIEPGQAFGTGEHESTNMCLRLSFDIDLSGKKVADVGCGSGIIGMCALKLGARDCYFSDLDKDALDNLKVNLELNGITNATVKHDSLLTNNTDSYDVIFANITADVLMLLAPQIESHLNKDGYLIISGIISERSEETLSCFEKYGFVVVNSLQMKDWRAYTLRRANGN